RRRRPRSRERTKKESERHYGDKRKNRPGPAVGDLIDEKDMRYKPLRHDEPMVISIEVAKYKVKRVLTD
ncbi:hypothetical protein CR513_18098, partial [Mucuna pruriens]